MAVAIKTIYDEVCASMNFNTTVDSAYASAKASAETYLTESHIHRLIYCHVLGGESQFDCVLRGNNFDFGSSTPARFQVYLPSKLKYTYWLSPFFTVESGVDYTLLASGAIEVTSNSNRDSRDIITVKAVPVNFALVMCDVFRVLGSHYARQITESLGSSSMNVGSVRSELMKQASFWSSEAYIQ